MCLPHQTKTDGVSSFLDDICPRCRVEHRQTLRRGKGPPKRQSTERWVIMHVYKLPSTSFLTLMLLSLMFEFPVFPFPEISSMDFPLPYGNCVPCWRESDGVVPVLGGKRPNRRLGMDGFSSVGSLAMKAKNVAQMRACHSLPIYIQVLAVNEMGWYYPRCFMRT